MDVRLHWIVLVQLLEDGIPVSLVVAFTLIAVSHALVFALVFALPYDNMGRLHIRIDAFFDLLVAVVLPLLLLLHSLSMFTFNLPLMAINERVYPPGFFERFAAAVADPVQVVAVRHNLESMQVNSVLKLCTRVGTVLALARRASQLAWMLIDELGGQARQTNVYAKSQRRLSRVFVLVAVAFVVFSAESVRTSALACKPHNECAQHAHRWLWGIQRGDLSRCPCLAVVDRDIMVTTLEQWLYPPDRTDKIAQLAAAGSLHTLQLVNRGLSVFPSELRTCKGLGHISLYYTNTERLPDWFGELTNLEYLLIEGKYPSSSLVELSDTVFNTMSNLAFLHFGMHRLAQLPSFDGLTGLKSLTLGLLPQLTELPKVDPLRALEQLSLISLPLLDKLPDLVKLRRLRALTVVDRGTICCNGFLGRDTCDLAHPMCGYHQIWHTPRVTQCVDESRIASAATRAIFDRLNSSACVGGSAPLGGIEVESTRDDIAQCNGTLFRRCHVAGLENQPAMCFNTRWMVIACHTYPFGIEMRREQIRLKLGRPCDPVEEAWLGCTK